MSFKTYCDICNKEITEHEVSVRGEYPSKHYHNKCWLDKKNWSKIHKLDIEKDDGYNSHS